MNINNNIFVSTVNFSYRIKSIKLLKNAEKAVISNLFETCKNHADAGNSQAMVNLGWLYKHGIGVERNYFTAYTWFMRGSITDNSNANYNIGLLYLKGLGVKQDIVQGLNLLTDSADKKNSIAMKIIGDYYFEKNDLDSALKWYKLSISYGNVYALNMAGQIYEKQGNYDDAGATYEKAANFNIQEAKQNLENLRNNILNKIVIDV